MSFRSLQKSFLFTIINILGLAVGLASFLLILQYMQHETSYDRFHKNVDNIFRVRADMLESGKLTNSWATSCAGIAPLMKERFPEVSEITRVVFREGMMSYRETWFREDSLMFVEPSFMKIFSFPMLRGDAIKALSEPNSVLISESYAKKYFGNEDPVGKTIKVHVDKTFDFMVKGIFKDVPSNSHMDFNVMLCYKTYIDAVEGETANSSLIGFHYYIYVLLSPNTKLNGTKSIEEKINALYSEIAGSLATEGPFKNTRILLHVQPLASIHLNSNYGFEIKQNGSPGNLYFMLLMALIILTVVSLNYILLTAAKALERFKEAGIRMVLGASRVQLIKQFFSESLLPAGISVLITLLIISLSLPFFNNLSGMSLGLSLFITQAFWLQLMAIVILIFGLSVLFPAFFLTARGPAAALKRQGNSFFGKFFLRKSLVVFEIVVALILIASTIVIFQQLTFMKNKDLGFDIKDTLVVRGSKLMKRSEYSGTYLSFKTKLLGYPEIKNISSSFNIPGMKLYSSAKVMHSLDDDKNSSFLYGVFCDYDYLPSYKVKLLAGRYFSAKYNDKFNSAILTKSAAELLGFKDNESAIGKKLLYFGGPFWVTVMGIVNNYCQNSLNREQIPILFICNPVQREYYSIKLSTKDFKSVIAKVKENWELFFPGEPFDYFFLDDFYSQQYGNESRFGKVFLVLSVISIILSCLGILGLSLSSLLRKTKEVGIRKVVGADVADILLSLYKDYLKLVVTANIIAIPLIYFLMDGWLKNFAYRIHLGWVPFVIAGIMGCILTLLTVSYHVVKMANSNPVISLKYE